MAAGEASDIDGPVPIPERVKEGAYLVGTDAYKEMYDASLADPDAWWGEKARELLTWFRPFSTVSGGSFEVGDIRWFEDGQLNVSYNCLDRHVAAGRGDDIAIIHEGDEPGTVRKFTYREALQEVCRVANVMTDAGVRKGDTVAVYMPMIPDLAFVMLACTRIGAVHSVVFAGFSADALRDRILDASSKWVFTADEGIRGGRTIHLKATVDRAVRECPCVRNVFVYQHTGADVAINQEVDVLMSEALPRARPFCPAVSMDAEDPMFILYTSGSTGTPKGLLHSTAGYLLYTAITHKYVFDVHPGDVYACVADCGWITGHSYIVYGPLCNGATTLMFESTPMYPNPSRYWDLVQSHKVTQFYTAPTAIRALMRFGTDPLEGYDLSSLRVLGTVGEPINPEAWRWYDKHVGKHRCAIVDTYWQTETGGHVLTTIPGCHEPRPGAAGFPFFGIDMALVDKDGAPVEGDGVDGYLVIRRPWPSIARTVRGDHERYLKTYMNHFRGCYFTGDGGRREDGHFRVTGRVDDVLSVSGHRIGSGDVESALVLHDAVAEAAVVGFPHEIKGQGICCFVTLVKGAKESSDLSAELRVQVRNTIGPFCTPDLIVITPGLPKTRSGKIMRRILRLLAEGRPDDLGDVSTLADPAIVETLKEKVAAMLASKK